MEEIKEYYCQFELTLDVMGGKWKPIILYYLGIEKILRYSELNRCMPSINKRMLTRQLRELEDDNLITRKVYQQVPPKVEYALTELGEELLPVLVRLKEWGIHYNNITKKASGFKCDVVQVK